MLFRAFVIPLVLAFVVLSWASTQQVGSLQNAVSSQERDRDNFVGNAGSPQDSVTPYKPPDLLRSRFATRQMASPTPSLPPERFAAGEGEARSACLLGNAGSSQISVSQGVSGHLPIDLPADARVKFEVDAPAAKLVPFLSLMFAGGGADSAGGKTIPIKTGLGTFNLAVKDLEALLSPIRELHVVAFTGDGKDASATHYEHEFTEMGMRKVATVGGSSSMLIMREDGPSGRYLAVLEQGKNVTVVRTDGMPDLGTIGQIALEKLTEAGTKMAHLPKH